MEPFRIKLNHHHNEGDPAAARRHIVFLGSLDFLLDLAALGLEGLGATMWPPPPVFARSGSPLCALQLWYWRGV